MKELNLGVRFLLELCLLAALAYAGLQVSVVLAVAAPLAAQCRRCCSALPW